MPRSGFLNFTLSTSHFYLHSALGTLHSDLHSALFARSRCAALREYIIPAFTGRKARENFVEKTAV